jgi:transcriptional regulator with XRE-family HTH domain
MKKKLHKFDFKHGNALEITELHKLIETSGIKVYQIGTQLGIAPSQVSLWLSGKSPIPLKHQTKLAEIFGVDVLPYSKQDKIKKLIEECFGQSPIELVQNISKVFEGSK